MRNVIVFMHVSLDGFVCRPNGELDWASMDEEIWKYVHDLQNVVDTTLFGRIAYQGFEAYWPSVTTNPSSTKNDIEHAQWLDQTQKIVFSKTLEQVAWQNARVATAPIEDEIARLKEQPGKDLLLFGGASTAETFIQKGLVDEYRLLINPVVLGSGKPLWKDIQDTMKLKLLEAKPFPSGVVGLHYQADKA